MWVTFGAMSFKQGPFLGACIMRQRYNGSSGTGQLGEGVRCTVHQYIWLEAQAAQLSGKEQVGNSGDPDNVLILSLARPQAT